MTQQKKVTNVAVGTRVMNVMHKSTTLVLFGLTLVGAYVVSNATYGIIKRRWASPIPVVEGSATTPSKD